MKSKNYTYWASWLLFVYWLRNCFLTAPVFILIIYCVRPPTYLRSPLSRVFQVPVRGCSLLRRFVGLDTLRLDCHVNPWDHHRHRDPPRTEVAVCVF